MIYLLHESLDQAPRFMWSVRYMSCFRSATGS